jgi:hypothetical protein
MKMGLDDFKGDLERTVWENKNNAKVMSVSGILGKGKYDISVKRSDDVVTIKCKRSKK